MTIGIYDIGDVVRIGCTFTVSGATTDPTTVTLSVKAPSGTVTSYTYAAGTVIKSGTGAYHKDLTVTETGTWYYSFVGTGAVATAVEGTFIVKTKKTI